MLIAALCFVISIKSILKLIRLIRMKKLEEIDRSDLLEGQVYCDIKWQDAATHLKLIERGKDCLSFEYIKGPNAYVADEDGIYQFSLTGDHFYKYE